MVVFLSDFLELQVPEPSNYNVAQRLTRRAFCHSFFECNITVYRMAFRYQTGKEKNCKQHYERVREKEDAKLYHRVDRSIRENCEFIINARALLRSSGSIIRLYYLKVMVLVRNIQSE